MHTTLCTYGCGGGLLGSWWGTASRPGLAASQRVGRSPLQRFCARRSRARGWCARAHGCWGGWRPRPEPPTQLTSCALRAHAMRPRHSLTPRGPAPTARAQHAADTPPPPLDARRLGHLCGMCARACVACRALGLIVRARPERTIAEQVQAPQAQSPQMRRPARRSGAPTSQPSRPRAHMKLDAASRPSTLVKRTGRPTGSEGGAAASAAR